MELSASNLSASECGLRTAPSGPPRGGELVLRSSSACSFRGLASPFVPLGRDWAARAHCRGRRSWGKPQQRLRKLRSLLQPRLQRQKQRRSSAQDGQKKLTRKSSGLVIQKKGPGRLEALGTNTSIVHQLFSGKATHRAVQQAPNEPD